MTQCHQCRAVFAEDEARVLAEVVIPEESRVEHVELHERCIADDPLMRYLWQNLRVERAGAAHEE